MKNRFLTVLILLGVTAFVCYGLPKPKYASPDVLSLLNVPERMEGWSSRDIAGNMDLRDLQYNFISRLFARQYGNKYGESLVFLILDAGNFHHPKICMTAAGSTMIDLPTAEFEVASRKIRAQCLFAQKPGQNMLIAYWICINGRQVDWTGQKIAQLWYSMFNKQKVGYMVRLEIPTFSQDYVANSLKLGQEFLTAVSDRMTEEEREYIFGK